MNRVRTLRLPLSGLYVPCEHGLQLWPLTMPNPVSHSHLLEPSGSTVRVKPGWHVQSVMDVDDALGVVEYSGQLVQAVAKFWPVWLL